MSRQALLLVEFDGGGFHGFQRQDGPRTVQGAIEEGWHRWLGETIAACSSSRTDAGVHGRRMPVALWTASAELPDKALVHGLNNVLGPDLAVVQARWPADDFHVRHDAFGKRYVYRLWADRVRSPHRRHNHWHIRRSNLDVAAMAEAARQMVGEHDFVGFRSVHCTASSTVRIMSRVEIRDRGPEINIVVEGNAFLHNMVRVMAGTLVDVGCGSIAASQVGEIIASRQRQRAGQTAPARGLTLEAVFYGPDGGRYGLDHGRLAARLAAMPPSTDS